MFKPNFTLTTHRLVYQTAETAPRAPESFKAPEKATDAQIAAEVAPMSPSQIVANTWSAGAAVTNQHVTNTKVMANLINDPLLTAPLQPLIENTQPTNA